MQDTLNRRINVAYQIVHIFNANAKTYNSIGQPCLQAIWFRDGGMGLRRWMAH
jgi:hypothetical protein